MREEMGGRFEDKSWEEIAAIARDLEVRIASDDKDARRLEANLRMIKQVLYETMRHPRAMRSLSSSFYVKLSKTMDRLEKQLKKYKAERSEFVQFLGVLLEKLKKEKLIVTKVKERKREFGKHKEDL